jgi:hypothetical protein
MRIVRKTTAVCEMTVSIAGAVVAAKGVALIVDACARKQEERRIS